MSQNKIYNILPDDGKLIDRVKIFSELCEKYSVDNEDVHIKVKDIPYFVSDKESVSSNNSEEGFEDKSVADEDQDPDFDVRKTLDDTLQIVQKRERNWRRNGIEKAMETFNINVSEKVENWIQNNSYYSSKCNEFFKPSNRISSGLKLYDEFHIRNHEIISEDESLQSVNTAKYILSNRKKLPHRKGKNHISGHFTAMTIKQFCYYNRQQSLSNDVNQYHKMRNNKSNLDSGFKAIKNSPENTKYPIKRTFNKENEKFPQKSRKKIKFKRKTKYPNSSYSLESSTDTTDQSTLDQNYKPKLISKSQNVYRKDKHSYSSKQKDKSSLDFDLNNVRCKIRNKIPLIKENHMHTSSQSDINFNVDNIINSTELNNLKNSNVKSLGTKNIDKSKYRHENSYSTYSSDESNLSNSYNMSDIKRKYQNVKKLYKTISPNQKSTSYNKPYEPLQKCANGRSNLFDRNDKNKATLKNIRLTPIGKTNQKDNSLINFESSNPKVFNNNAPKDKTQNIKQFQPIPNKSLNVATSSDSRLFSLCTRKDPKIINSIGKYSYSKTKKKFDVDSEQSDNSSIKSKEKSNVAHYIKQNLNTITEESGTPKKFSKSYDTIAKSKENFSRLTGMFNKKVKVMVRKSQLIKEKTGPRQMTINVKLQFDNLESRKAMSNESRKCKLFVEKKIEEHRVSKNFNSAKILNDSHFSEKTDANEKEKCRSNAHALKILNKNKQESKGKPGLHKENIGDSFRKTNNENVLDMVSVSDNSDNSIKISQKQPLKKNSECKCSQSSQVLTKRKQGLHKENIGDSFLKTNNENMSDIISISENSDNSTKISQKQHLKKSSECKCSQSSQVLTKIKQGLHKENIGYSFRKTNNENVLDMVSISETSDNSTKISQKQHLKKSSECKCSQSSQVLTKRKQCLHKENIGDSFLKTNNENMSDIISISENSDNSTKISQKQHLKKSSECKCSQSSQVLTKRKQGLHKENIRDSFRKTNNENVLDMVSISDNSDNSIKISQKHPLKTNSECKYNQSSQVLSTPSLRRLSTQSLQSNTSTNNKSSLFRKSFNSREPHIVLYKPDDEDCTIKYSEICNKDIIINESTLESKIGLSLTKKFLNGRKSYKKIFNKQSTIIFILPNESNFSSCTESEIDELEQAFSNTHNKTGKIVEVIKYKHC